jgi:hypothetical protein
MYYAYNWWWLTWIIPVLFLLWLLFARSDRRSDYGLRNAYYYYPDDDDAYWLARRGRRTGKHRNRGPRNYRRSDSRIAEDINDRLTVCDDLDATDVEVHVDQGRVLLDGFVVSRFEKRLAEAIADGVAGVADVENRLRIGRASRDLPASTELRSSERSGAGTSA